MATKDDSNAKYTCERCGKLLSAINFYTYRDGTKCEICKPCLTAHIDNQRPQTFIWILKKMDVPYIPTEWNVLLKKAYDKDPYKINGMSVIGKYLAKMKLRQWNQYRFEDTERIQKQLEEQQQQKVQVNEEEKQKYEAELKEQLDNGEISMAEYQTLVRTQTQMQNLPELQANKITGQINDPYNPQQDFIGQMRNPFQQQLFIPQGDMVDPGAQLDQQDKLYLAMKWGRLYSPSQWVTLEQLYKEFMDSFDIQGAARIDTLKMICKTSLKMNEAIDMGDIDTYQKLSRVYDAMMKSAKFTQAQNNESNSDTIDSASAIVDFVEAHSGQIPRYDCNQPRDIVDKVINDLKQYNRSLIYEDKALAQQIEQYLQDRRIADQMKKDKQEAENRGLDTVEIEDDDYVEFKQAHQQMNEHDKNLSDQFIEQEYAQRRVQVNNETSTTT